ncbi:hypothetical protein Q3H58_003442 [Pseudomonas psychrotolerans]|nr:hypothetical protein [Pseudomonas psychrotolerans]
MRENHPSQPKLQTNPLSPWERAGVRGFPIRTEIPAYGLQPRRPPGPASRCASLPEPTAAGRAPGPRGGGGWGNPAGLLQQRLPGIGQPPRADRRPARWRRALGRRRRGLAFGDRPQQTPSPGGRSPGRTHRPAARPAVLHRLHGQPGRRYRPGRARRYGAGRPPQPRFPARRRPAQRRALRALPAQRSRQAWPAASPRPRATPW